MKKNEKDLLIWLLILAIVFIVLIKFVLADITEILDKGSEFGEIIYNLSLAYISSYIFYQIVVAIPQKRNEKNIHESTSFISYGIIHSGSRIVKPKKSQEAYLDITDSANEISESEFENICKSIGLYDTFDFKWTKSEISQITYLEHFKKTRKKIIENKSELFAFMPHLETEHIKLINEIVQSPFISMGHHYLENEKILDKKEKLDFMFPMLFDFYTKIRRLNKYMNGIKL
ncbi:hypothetical protein EI546_11095 [Aequorivita sp. H23M31]|uniref:Uncharacterized protein n=1 Tax=Aequorivita ciconiae TaxID=2494375 RepID=A0A410G4Q0_9FLAO|nr:hypothetical protein [Aequorivita sp. H23M31]QAA82233.1 hypothetical protein EI546_11095 [Aequorivita sp. H23M31]